MKCSNSNKRPHAFGATLKVRLSSSLSICNQTLRGTKQLSQSAFVKQGLKWPYAIDSGIFGSVSPSNYDDSLVMMGACDDFSTISFEVDMLSQAGSTVNSAGIDQHAIDLPPCIQTSFVYTALVNAGNSHYITVRRLRVFTMTLAVATDSEQFFKSLDAEVLGVVRG